MAGFGCRFCSGNTGGDNGFISLEIRLRNRKIIIYICPACFSHLRDSTVTRCLSCGNIWMQQNGTGRYVRTVGHCSRCKGDDSEDVAGIVEHRGR
jgi:uncharacterized protein YlaI